jgi:hypothetical protein
MTQNAYLGQVRVYAALALRMRRSFVPAVRQLTEMRWGAIIRDVTDPAERERQRVALAAAAARDYGRSDPQFQPGEVEALAWLVMPPAE